MSSRLNIIPTSESHLNPHPGEIGEQTEFAGNVALVTLGCAKNLVDSEVMLGALVHRGFHPVVDAENADLIVVNTCAFLQSAVEESVDRILELARYKSTGRCRKLVVAGCLVERYRGDLIESLPEVDHFLTTDELLKAGAAGTLDAKALTAASRPYFLYDENSPRVRSTGRHSAYVKIAEGCGRPCSFCIIPKLRGNFRSRETSSVESEIRELLEQGVREINFVAQDLTAYGNDLRSDEACNLTQLLRRVEPLKLEYGLFWIRLLYAYPVGVTRELIDTIAESKVVCKYLDLPLQHISASVLKGMQRPLGAKRTRELIENIRNWAPQIALRSTFIVGFPGESDQDIAQLEAFVAEGHFTHVGVFCYSQEEEAKSFHFDEQVPPELSAERRERIMTAQHAVVQKRMCELKGLLTPALLEGDHSESNLLLSARTQWQAPETDGEVIVNEIADELLEAEDFDRAELSGRFVDIEITGHLEYDLLAKVTGL